MASINQLQDLTNQYNNFKNAYNNAGIALNNVLEVGTVLYNNGLLPVVFPSTYQSFQTYLLNLQSAINNFIAGLPVEPSLNG